MTRPLGRGLAAACAVPLAFALALALAFAVAVAFAPVAGSPVLAAGPTPTPAPAGDPRSSGQGPGFVGEPLLAIATVLAVAALSVLLTLAYVRLTAGRDRG